MTQERVQEVGLPEPPPGSIADLYREILPGVEFRAEQTAIDVALTVRRDDLVRVMQTAKEDPRLALDFLRSLSGVDHITHLEVVYHLYSYKLGHSVAIKVQCPYEDTHVPTLSHLWQTANWHERETHELFGIVFDGHPDLRPLLTEEGLGYYILRKSHPLAEIEDWQEDHLTAIETARTQMAVAPEGAAAPPMDERAAKVALAQKKAAFIKQVREEARAKGLSPEEEKAAVQAGLKRFEAEQATAAAPAAPAPAQPVDERAAKIALAQKKAAVIKQTRDDARAKGLSSEDERRAVAEALKALAEGEKGG